MYVELKKGNMYCVAKLNPDNDHQSFFQHQPMFKMFLKTASNY